MAAILKRLALALVSLEAARERSVLPGTPADISGMRAAWPCPLEGVRAAPTGLRDTHVKPTNLCFTPLGALPARLLRTSAPCGEGGGDATADRPDVWRVLPPAEGELRPRERRHQPWVGQTPAVLPYREFAWICRRSGRWPGRDRMNKMAQWEIQLIFICERNKSINLRVDRQGRFCPGVQIYSVYGTSSHTNALINLLPLTGR